MHSKSRLGPASLSLCVALASAAAYLVLNCRAVRAEHVAFVILTSSYAVFANFYIRSTFHSLPLAPLSSRTLAPMRNSVRLLFPFTFVFSLSVPTLLLITAGKSPIHGAQTRLYPILGPHLFLMICQILVETVGFIFSSAFTLYVRFGLTVAFVVYRLPIALEWYYQAERYARSEEAALLPSAVLPLTQAAAILNIVYWSFSLLCFLLLYCLPAILRDPQSVITGTNTERTISEAVPEDRRK